MWPQRDLPFHVQAGDIGAPVFGKGDESGMQFVGMVGRIWVSKALRNSGHRFTRCVFFTPAMTLFKEMEASTGMKWSPVFV